MKNKEKQIEVNKIIELIRPLNIVCDNNDCEKCPCSVENRLCTEERVARVIIEHYQPKLPKDSVVLSRAEYNWLVNSDKEKIVKENKELGNQCLQWMELYHKQLIKTEQSSKETAKKIFTAIEKILSITEVNNGNPNYKIGFLDCRDIVLNAIRELANQDNIEIKE